MRADIMPDPAQLAAVWSLPEPLALRPVPHGVNNRSWYVTAAAARYVLRVYHHSADPRRIAREHALLRALGALPLTFRVPVPLPARDGETIATLQLGDCDSLAALFPWIAGHHPRRGDPAATRAAGVALGELDAALARLTLPPALAGAPSPETLLDEVHPAVPDVRALPDRLTLDVGRRRRLARILAGVAEAASGLYRALPHQWIHADFGAANILMQTGTVTGVLDFEFAHVDLRAVDPAWALNFFAFDTDKRADLSLLDAFGTAYAQHAPLTEPERRALPLLIRLCRTIVAIHWCARYLTGTAPREVALGNVDALLKQDDWLSERGDELVAHALRWPSQTAT